MARQALIVEDEPGLGHLLAAHLRHRGFEPTVHLEGRAAVAWTRANQPDLVLLDLMLPDVDGYDLCRDLKLHRDTNPVPVVMVTGRVYQEDRVRGLEVGADHYLTKPFAWEQLDGAIDVALAGRADRERRGLDGEVHFRLRSATEHLAELNRLLASLFLHTGFAESEVKHLMVAVRELGANAIEWGHRNRVEEIVTVTYHIDAENLTLVIRDNGPGFDLRRLPHAATAEDPVSHMAVRKALGIREGGLGILMAQGLVDELRYNETGNEVRLVKRLPRREGASGPPPEQA